jgi:DNA-binding beta-propeller fold protein YncE
VAGPSAGFVFDQSAHALRRIQGIPGASVVGTPVDFGFAVTAAYAAPRLDSAFVLAADGGVHVFRLTGDAPVERAVYTPAGPARVVFSPSGSAAALYFPGNVQVIKGLPDAPQVAANIRLRVDSRSQRQGAETLAVSDDGAYLLYSAGGTLELMSAAGNNRQIKAGGAGALAAFAPGNHDAVVINGSKLILFQDIAGAATERTFDGIAAPSAVAFSPDSRKVLVASATGKSVTTILVATGERSALGCDCAPAALIPMGSVFRLNELGNEPLWLLDTASDRGLVFVPAPAAN